MRKIKNSEIVTFIRDIYSSSDNEVIPLHEPRFISNEKDALNDCIDSTYVSTVGEYVTKFEKKIGDYTGAKHVIPTTNGTSALHVSMIAAGVRPGDEVITQAFTFVATCNAINYCNAKPVFVDISRETLGLCPKSLKKWLKNNSENKKNNLYNKKTGAKITAVVPMHTFGHSCQINEIRDICKEFNLILIEDTAEALGSFSNNKHLGVYGDIGTLSFNGNKIITTGGGGAVLTNNDNYAERIRHISTTARVKTKFTFDHDEIGYNYRMPNLNAALGCAQMESLEDFLTIKAQLANQWNSFFNERDVDFVNSIDENKSNHWLNAIILESRKERDEFLRLTNEASIMTRPIWTLMSKLPMFKNYQSDGLKNSLWLEDRVVNIPSSVPDGALNKLDKE